MYIFSDVEEREDEDTGDAGEGTSAQPDKGSKKTTVVSNELYSTFKASVSDRSFTQLDEGEYKEWKAQKDQLVTNYSVFVSYKQKAVYVAALLGKTLKQMKDSFDKKTRGKKAFTTYIQDLVKKSKGSDFVKKGSKKNYGGFSSTMINFYIKLHELCMDYKTVMYTSIAIRDFHTNFKYLKQRII